jgi:hypothetical protein
LDPFSSGDTGDTAGETAGDAGDGDTGDGDGTSGDGSSGDGTSGDGDGDGTSGDGDGATGDGDGTMMCGNGAIEGFEDCDCGTDGTCEPAELGGVACNDLTDPLSGNVFDGGNLGCNLSCIHDTTECFVCGDGVVSQGEPCDGSDLGTSTCGDEGFLGGTLSCNTDCSLNTSMCTMATWSEDFESGGFLASPWGPGGVSWWTVDDQDASGGTYSAKSGATGSGQQSELAINLNVPTNGVISYQYKMTGGSMDVLFGGVIQETYSGSGGTFTDISLPHPGGIVRLIFRFRGNSPTDFARVDNVRSDATPVPANCGDGWLTFDEECDGANYGGLTCGTQGFLGGLLSCDATCTMSTAGCSMATWNEDFESADFLANPWGPAGNAAWTIDTTDGANGTATSVRSGGIGQGQTSDLGINLAMPTPGTVAFAYKTDTFDDLEVLFNGAVNRTFSGTGGTWTDAALAHPGGNSVVTFRYNRSGTGGGSDAVWIDEVRADGNPIANTCGDDWLTYDEECDTSSFGTRTCGTEGFLGGALTCDGACMVDTAACTMSAWSEDFESGDFLQAPWGIAGAQPWTIDGTTSSGGVNSARSGLVGAGETSDLGMRLTVPTPGAVAFSYRTDTSEDLEVLFDGAVQATYTGTGGGWTDVTLPHPGGMTDVTFRFNKTNTFSSGADAVWIDDVRSDGTPIANTCGDGWLVYDELCDGTALGPRTCGGEGFLGGMLACTGACMLDTSACTTATFSDDFETGDFSGAPYVQGMSGWLVDMSMAAGGSSYATHNADIGDSQQTSFSLPMTWAAAGTIAFQVATDTESCCDHLEFYVDSVFQQDWSGQTGWTDVSFPVTAGAHTLEWRYDKDGSVSTGADNVWVDDIRSDGAP